MEKEMVSKNPAGVAPSKTAPADPAPAEEEGKLRPLPRQISLEVDLSSRKAVVNQLRGSAESRLIFSV